MAVFNASTTDEIAVLILGQVFEKRDIVLHSRGSDLIRISETHRGYNALQYPLMFCHGEDGYCIDLHQIDPNTKTPLKKAVSATNFYCYRLMERHGEMNYLLLFRNLLNHFLVDMYAKIESERWNFIKKIVKNG